jgi:tetratricopeptide (TPR) repeat protein
MRDKLGTWVTVVSCVVLLSACANKPTSALDQTKPAIELSVLMDKAATSEKEKHFDIALREYEEAAKLYPSSSLPWVRIAQIRYEAGNYGEAISAAQQAVARENRNNVALSIMAVSGLRVSSTALDELRRHNDLTGPIQKEAQELAKVLRMSLGEQVLVPSGGTAATNPNSAASAPAARRRSTKSAKPAAAAKTSSGSPFGALE